MQNPIEEAVEDGKAAAGDAAPDGAWVRPVAARTGAAPAAPDAGAPAPREALASQARWVAAWRAQLATAGGREVDCIETHISWVLIDGDRAYKLKKALRNGFLDASTLALRRHHCEEELRLNRRLAPSIYLGVGALCGNGPALSLVMTAQADDPSRATGPETIPPDLREWVVVMRAFDRSELWDALAARGELDGAQVDALAREVAAFQARAAVAPPDGDFGSPARIQADWDETLQALRAGLDPADAAAQADLRALCDWQARTGARLAPLHERRLAEGRVREGHGDLHLGNVVRLDGHATVFDGIDFNPGLRWIDTASEVAFLAMDLAAHGLHGLAHRFINAWLEAGGDYAAVPLLDAYAAYRAAVRAKVALLRAAQSEAGPMPAVPGCPPAAPPREDGAAGLRAQAGRYLALACDFAGVGRPRPDAPPRRLAPMVLITHGPSGSGKTTLTQGLVDSGGVVRIRSDAERKRRAGLDPAQPSGSPLNGGLYADAQREAVLAQVLAQARRVLEGGRAVVLDATFLRHGAREAARLLAQDLGLPFRILHLSASEAVLRERVRERARRGGDASEADEAVLDEQLRSAQALRPSEWAVACAVQPLAGLPGEAPRVDWATLIAQWQADALRAAAATRA